MRNYQQMDLQYFTDVVVGNQSLHGILDTGSFEILVFSDACRVCGEPQSLYSSRTSATYSRGLYGSTHAFGSGIAYAVEGFERIAFGPLLAPNISFWEVYDADMPVLSQSDFQAILGVGPPGVPEMSAWSTAAQDRRRLSAWEDMMSHMPKPLRQFTKKGQAQLSRLANQSMAAALYTETRNDSLLEALNVTSFSVCLGKEHGSEGYFIWHDDAYQKRPGLFKPLPVVGRHTWGVRMTGVHIGSGSRGEDYQTNDVACLDGCGAILDSGTSLLVMPRIAAERIAKALEAGGATCDQNQGVSGLPHLHFQLGEHGFSLPPEAYLGTIIGRIPKSMSKWWLKDSHKVLVCGLQLTVLTQEAETQFGPMWILGMPLFRQYYVNFNLAKASSPLNRSMNLALAGEACEPADAPKAALLSGERSARSIDAAGESIPVVPAEPQRFRTIDASMLRVPRWATRAFASGIVHI